MFFILPVGVDYRAQRYPVVTFVLMGLNAVIYLISLALWFTDRNEMDPLVLNLGLIPAEKTWWTWLTSTFVHGGFFHFAGNMIYLFLFGACVEDLMGRGRFTIFYLAGGLLASLSQVLLTTELDADLPIVGASGAISACIGAFLIVLPRRQIEFRYFIWLFFRGWSGEFSLRAWIVIGFWFLSDLGSLMLELGSTSGSGGVAFGAHVGGTLAGALVMWAMRHRLKTDDDNTPHRPAATAPVAVDEPGVEEPATVFLLIEGEQAGPFAPSKVRAMVKLGSLPTGACFWQDGMAEWRPMEEL
jgi:membrane associated rhomboid family serine protease